MTKLIFPYRELGGLSDVDQHENVWSLVCFFVRRELRGQGISKQVIEAAVLHAAKNGATIVEAYPVDVGSPSYRFMGYVPAFLAAGFQHFGRAGTRRHVMRRTVDHLREYNI